MKNKLLDAGLLTALMTFLLQPPAILAADALPAAAGGSDLGLEEVVVSAQKREERLRDVPVPVTAVDAAALLTGNQVRFQDYYATIPGVSYVADNKGDANVAIRGLTTGGSASGSHPSGWCIRAWRPDTGRAGRTPPAFPSTCRAISGPTRRSTTRWV